MLGLQHGSLVSTLREELQDQIRQAGKLRAFGDGQLIAARGDSEPALWIIEQGRVRVCTCNQDGMQLETAILESGDSFGEFTLFAAAPRYFDFFAMGDCHVRHVSKARFEPLLRQSPALQDAIISMLSKRLLHAVRMIDDMRRLPLIAQLAQTLLQRAQLDASTTVFRGTQTELAEYLGVSRVALGQALNKLKSRGLVETAYAQIQLPNPQALQHYVNTQRAL